MSKSYVITEFFGGLGNQMFIYAMARALALRLHSELILDYDQTFTPDCYGRTYELGSFQIAGKRSRFLKRGTFLRRLNHKLMRETGYLFPFGKVQRIVEGEDHLLNDSLINDELKNPYLMGYWQTELYFRTYRDIIKKDFTFRIGFSEVVEKYREYIESFGNRAVALCVRRYQECQKLFHITVLQEDYYLRAFDKIYESISDPVIFVFSQAHDWVRQHLEPKLKGQVVYVSASDGSSFSNLEDLYLMEHFRHYVISNSTFYWWGAYLSRCQNPQVIAPDNWPNHHTNCPEWLVLPARK